MLSKCLIGIAVLCIASYQSSDYDTVSYGPFLTQNIQKVKPEKLSRAKNATNKPSREPVSLDPLYLGNLNYTLNKYILGLGSVSISFKNVTVAGLLKTKINLSADFKTKNMKCTMDFPSLKIDGTININPQLLSFPRHVSLKIINFRLSADADAAAVWNLKTGHKMLQLTRVSLTGSVEKVKVKVSPLIALAIKTLDKEELMKNVLKTSNKIVVKETNSFLRDISGSDVLNLTGLLGV